MRLVPSRRRLRSIARFFFTPGRGPLLNTLGIALALVIVGFVVQVIAGIAVFLFTPIPPLAGPEGAPVPPTTVTVVGVTPCERGTCVAVRPVAIAVEDGPALVVQPGETVTDAAPVQVLGADGATATSPYLDVTYRGTRGRAFRLDPNDGGLVFRAAAGK